MIIKPAQLGMAKLDNQELVEDRKSCKNIGPCGVGKKALYLNSFYIDRRYYLPYGSISRVFKRVAMSSGGFTGKGMFASMAYLVVEYDGGKQKQCNFKDERDVDKLLEVLAKEQPQIPLLSEAGEQALQKKEAEKAARKLPELTDETVSAWGIDGVSIAEELIRHLTAEAKAQYAEDMAESLTAWLSDEIADRSTFLLDPDEVRAEEEEGRQWADELLRNAGLDPEAADDDAVMAVSGKTKQEHYDFVRSVYVGGLKSACLGTEMMAADGVEITGADYQKALTVCAESMGVSPEEAAQKVLPYEKYLRQAAADYQFTKLENYVKNYLTQEESK